MAVTAHIGQDLVNSTFALAKTLDTHV